MNKLIIIAGPTAVGKTEISVGLAQRLNAEIISADSMQVYKGMDIGTAKISQAEMKQVPHYLIDVLSPFEDFNITRFQSMAQEALKTIYNNKHIPILAGGTGFYIQSLLYEIAINDRASGNSGLRAELEAQYDKLGADYMYQRLREIDLESAAAIHKNNKKRLVRAIEYFLLTGDKISAHNKKQKENKSPYDFKYFVLNMDREILYKRIDLRVDRMMEEGLVDEVKRLKAEGLTSKHLSMQGIGYKQLFPYLDGQYSLSKAIELIKKETRHFAKRQLTWFKREKAAIWIDVLKYDSKAEIINEIISCI